MTVFTADEIAGLQSSQESFMQDTCQVGVRGSSQDALGELVDTFTYGSAQACGLTMSGGLQRNEFRTSDGTIVYADAALRLAHDAVVTSDDTVKITHRYGSAVTNVIYEVMGEPLVGSSGIVCYLRRVST